MASAQPKPDFDREWRRRESNPRKVPFEPVVALNLTARIRRG
jgi:hypothetical protein